MRILIFNWKGLGHPAAGGAEVYAHEVAKYWATVGHTVTFFCASPDGATHDECVDGIRFVRRGGKVSVYREARQFYETELRGHYDVVLDIVNTRPFLTPDWIHDAPVVALIYQVAREIWAHELPMPAAVVGRHWLEKRWLRRYQSVPTLTISESSRDSLHQYGLSDVSVVPVGVTLPDVLPDAEKASQPTVLFAGRLASNKRPDDAIAAFRLAAGRVSGARMVVVGTGPMEAPLRRKFESDEIVFLGRVGEAEKFELMRRATALVVTSVREGWGMVVTEAAAVGTPAIAYDVPGLRDSIRCTGGVLVEPTTASLAEALVKLLPQWLANPPVPDVTGIASWKDAAEGILSHLESARRCVRP